MEKYADWPFAVTTWFVSHYQPFDKLNPWESLCLTTYLVLLTYLPIWVILDTTPGFLGSGSSCLVKTVRASNGATILCKKFKNLHYELKNWSKNISKRSIAIENSNKALAGIDSLQKKKRRALTIPGANFGTILKKHLLRLLCYDKQYWKNRCIITFNLEESLKLFKAMAFERYRRNTIPSLTTLDGSCIEDHDGKESIIFQSFKESLARPPQMRWNLIFITLLKRLKALISSLLLLPERKLTK